MCHNVNLNTDTNKNSYLLPLRAGFIFTKIIVRTVAIFFRS